MQKSTQPRRFHLFLLLIDEAAHLKHRLAFFVRDLVAIFFTLGRSTPAGTPLLGRGLLLGATMECNNSDAHQRKECDTCKE